MNITAIKITKNSKNYNNIKKLYKTSFPKNERNPFRLLIKWTNNQSLNFTAYYDKEVFLGFTYTSEIDNNIYILYFVVSENLRSKGYGTHILKYIIAKNPNSTIYVNIENLDKDTNNFEQRLRRFNFYNRNGFKSTYKCDGQNKFMILTNKIFNIDEYIKLQKNYNKNYCPKIKDIN